MRVITLTLPMPPNVANARGHWRTRCRAVNGWKALALVRESKLRGRRIPMQRATLALTFYVGKPQWLMDDDNLTGRVKPIGDLLRERGLILDDKRPYLTLEGIPEQRTSTPRRVELTLTEVAG